MVGSHAFFSMRQQAEFDGIVIDLRKSMTGAGGRCSSVEPAIFASPGWRRQQEFADRRGDRIRLLHANRHMVAVTDLFYGHVP